MHRPGHPWDMVEMVCDCASVSSDHQPSSKPAKFRGLYVPRCGEDAWRADQERSGDLSVSINQNCRWGTVGAIRPAGRESLVNQDWGAQPGMTSGLDVSGRHEQQARRRFVFLERPHVIEHALAVPATRIPE